MSASEDDEIVIGTDGSKASMGAVAFGFGRLMAYQGKKGCRSLTCRRMYLPGSEEMGECHGWHCAVCDEPSSQYGHADCAPEESSDA